MAESHNDILSYQEYKNGMEELQNTEGWQLARRLEHLGLSFYIFKTNRDYLLQCIEYFKTPEALLLWDVRNNAEMERFLKEVMRQLHNFAAGAKTLVEHTRILAREMYEGTDFLEEYEAEVTRRFTLNPMVQFVHKLRDYILHRDLPVTSANLTSKFDSSLRISIREMRAWRSWTGLSRQYVDTAQDEEKIEDIVTAYTNAIIGFHDWFHERHVELHKEAYGEAEELRQRLVNSRWHLKL
jgi:hypothetical protein